MEIIRDVAGEKLTSVSNEDRHDKSVNTDNTSHNNGDNTLDDQVRAEDSHRGKANTSLGSAVGSSEAYVSCQSAINARKKGDEGKG